MKVLYSGLWNFNYSFSFIYAIFPIHSVVEFAYLFIISKKLPVYFRNFNFFSFYFWKLTAFAWKA